jgi:hypothetical protein
MWNIPHRTTCRPMYLNRPVQGNVKTQVNTSLARRTILLRLVTKRLLMASSANSESIVFSTRNLPFIGVQKNFPKSNINVIVRSTRSNLILQHFNFMLHKVSHSVPISSQRASVASYSERCSYFINSCHLDERGAKILRNVGSYKSHKT